MNKATSVNDQTKALIEDVMVGHLMKQVPTANPRPMYGGIVFELEIDNPKSRIGGVYGYEHHVSVEFANGTSLPDVHGVLEGTGKFRRHIKLKTLSDIEGKHCKHFLDLAIALHST